MPPASTGGPASSNSRRTRAPRKNSVRSRRRAVVDARNDQAKQDDVDDADSDRTGQSMRLYRKPRTRAVSPYRPHSDAADLRLQELIHYYTTVVVTCTVTPVGPRYEWFPFASLDTALFHAVMSHTAAHSAYRRKSPLPHDAEYYWHTGQAIQLVNKRLREGTHKRNEEATICAVCCLTQQQAFAGHVENTRVHLSGLMQLVRTAGGWESAQISSKTRRFIYLTDLASCITLHQTPQLPPPSFLVPLQTISLIPIFGPPSLHTSSLTHSLLARLENFSDSPQPSLRATHVFWGLRNLSLLLEEILAGHASPDGRTAEDVQFTDRVEALERCTLGLWCWDVEAEIHGFTGEESHRGGWDNAAAGKKDTTIFKLLGHATLIYIYTRLRQLPSELGMLRLVSSRIVSLLQSPPSASTINVLLATFPDLMVWVMFQAGSVAAGPLDRIFLARQVSKVLAVRKVDETEAVRTAMGRFLWPEERQGMTAERSWSDVALMALIGQEHGDADGDVMEE